MSSSRSEYGKKYYEKNKAEIKARVNRTNCALAKRKTIIYRLWKAGKLPASDEVAEEIRESMEKIDKSMVEED